MRGAYAAGALIDLYEKGRLDVDAVWATSSGAASAAYAMAGQPEGIDIWRDHLHGARLVSRMRFLTGRSALDLDYLVGEVFQRRIPLDAARLRASPIPLLVPATDVDAGDVRYFDLRRSDPFVVLRAAMSLPGATLEAVHIEDGRYVDGGVVDPLPVEAALRGDPDELTVVMTRPSQYVAPPISRAGLWLASRRFPGIRDALRRRHERYRDALEALGHASQRIPVTLVRPTGGLPVERWTTDRRRILAAIEQGASDAQRALALPTT